jgi:hypothetical protein
MDQQQRGPLPPMIACRRSSPADHARRLVRCRTTTICLEERVTSLRSTRGEIRPSVAPNGTGGTKRPSVNQSRTWSEEAFGTTEFLFADYRDFAFPPLHETFAIGIIETGAQQFRPGRASSLVMPAGTLCAINPGVVHEGRPATSQGWRYRLFYPSPALVARTLGDSQHPSPGGDWGLDCHVINDRELYPEFAACIITAARDIAKTRDTHCRLPPAVV